MDSTELCGQRYEKEIFTPTAYISLMDMLGLDTVVIYSLLQDVSLHNMFYQASHVSKAVFAAIYEWRDRIAREIDESTTAVMHHNVMKKLAVSLPTTVAKFTETINPIPPQLRSRVTELTDVIKVAIANAGTAPTPQVTNVVHTSSMQDVSMSLPGMYSNEIAQCCKPFVPLCTDEATLDDIKKLAGWLRAPDMSSNDRVTKLQEEAAGSEIIASAFAIFDLEPTDDAEPERYE